MSFNMPPFSAAKQLLASVLFSLAILGTSTAQTVVFSDNFSTSTSNSWTSSSSLGGWSVTRSGSDFGARRNSSQLLELSNDISGSGNSNGWVAVSKATSDYSSPYNTTLGSNPGLVRWSFNIRQVRTDPAGMGDGNYGVAFILAASNSNVMTDGNGYAIVHGQSGSTDPVRLVRYTGGLRGTLTDMIVSNTDGLGDFGAEYLSVQINYNPFNNEWELFVRNDGGSSFTDPATGT
jgi:hypothetical protein